MDPRFQARFGGEFDAFVAGPPVALDALPPGDQDGLLRRLTADGLDVFAVDVTTDDVRSAGLHVTRVLVPGLVCNSAVRAPLLGGTRLRDRLAGRLRREFPLPH